MKKILKICSIVFFLIIDCVFSITQEQQYLVNHVQNSIELALAEKSNIDPAVLEIEGWSSPKVRHFLNNICTLPQANYLEIGLWKGSTFVSALSNNKTLNSAIAIDNWSKFGGPRDVFFNRVARYTNYNFPIICEEDAFKVDKKKLFRFPVTIYFYDGEHSFAAQKAAFTYYNDVFADTFIAIVDDYNFQETQQGTAAAFIELGYQILFEKILPANGNGDIKNWWNGVYVAVVAKKQDNLKKSVTSDASLKVLNLLNDLQDQLVLSQKNDALLEDVATEKPLVIISAMYNNKNYCEENLRATMNQQYKNYRVVIIDDASTDGTAKLVAEYLKKHDPSGKKVTFIRNTKRRGALANIYQAVQFCKDNEIVLLVDGDDFLAHKNVLQTINNVYANRNVWMTYGNYINLVPWEWHFSSKLPAEVIAKNAYRDYQWVTSHLKTFYAWLFKQIKYEDLTCDGDFYPMCTDQCTMFPMLEMAGIHSRFIEEVLLIYNNASPINLHKTATGYNKYREAIRKTPRYTPLTSLPF